MSFNQQLLEQIRNAVTFIINNSYSRNVSIPRDYAQRALMSNNQIMGSFLNNAAEYTLYCISINKVPNDNNGVMIAVDRFLEMFIAMFCMEIIQQGSPEAATLMQYANSLQGIISEYQSYVQAKNNAMNQGRQNNMGGYYPNNNYPQNNQMPGGIQNIPQGNPYYPNNQNRMGGGLQAASLGAAQMNSALIVNRTGISQTVPGNNEYYPAPPRQKETSTMGESFGNMTQNLFNKTEQPSADYEGTDKSLNDYRSVAYNPFKTKMKIIQLGKDEYKHEFEENEDMDEARHQLVQTFGTGFTEPQNTQENVQRRVGSLTNTIHMGQVSGRDITGNPGFSKKIAETTGIQIGLDAIWTDARMDYLSLPENERVDAFQYECISVQLTDGVDPATRENIKQLVSKANDFNSFSKEYLFRMESLKLSGKIPLMRFINKRMTEATNTILTKHLTISNTISDFMEDHDKLAPFLQKHYGENVAEKYMQSMGRIVKYALTMLDEDSTKNLLLDTYGYNVSEDSNIALFSNTILTTILDFDVAELEFAFNPKTTAMIRRDNTPLLFLIARALSRFDNGEINHFETRDCVRFRITDGFLNEALLISVV